MRTVSLQGSAPTGPSPGTDRDREAGACSRARSHTLGSRLLGERRVVRPFRNTGRRRVCLAKRAGRTCCPSAIRISTVPHCSAAASHNADRSSSPERRAVARYCGRCDPTEPGQKVQAMILCAARRSFEVQEGGEPESLEPTRWKCRRGRQSRTHEVRIRCSSGLPAAAQRLNAPTRHGGRRHQTRRGRRRHQLSWGS